MSKLGIPRAVGLTTIVLSGALIAGCGSSSSSTTAGSSAASSSAPTAASTPASTTPASTTPAPSASTGAAQVVKLSANPEGQLSYNTTTLTAKAGKVSIDFTNMASLGHNVTIASASGAVVGATPTFQSGSKTLSLNLKPGTYAFFCSVPGHRQGGMQGTLTVQ